MTRDLEQYAPMGQVGLADHGNVARWVSVLVPAAQLAERIANTEFVPRAMRGKPDAITACVMYGDEIGIGPMQALASIHVVEGRPYPSAELLRAMILRDGHSLVVHEMTGTRCRMSGLRAGAQETDRLAIEWTLDMARAAGLLGKDNWRKYPRAMLAARCTADLARLAFPDVVKGLGYLADTEDDAALLDAMAPADQEAAPKRTRKAVQRRTKPRKAIPARDVPREAWGDDQPLPVRPLDPDAPAYEDTDLPEPHQDPLPPSAMPEPIWKCPEPGCRFLAQSRGNLDAHALTHTPTPEPAPLEPPPDVNPRTEPRDDTPPVAPLPKGPGPQLLRALHASLGRALGRGPDATVDRDQRLLLCGAMVGRELTSTNDLSRTEAMRCLDVLAAIAAGEATWQEDDQGRLEILDLRTPPDDGPDHG